MFTFVGVNIVFILCSINARIMDHIKPPIFIRSMPSLLQKKKKRNLNSQILIEKELNGKFLMHFKLTSAHLSISHNNQTVNFSAGTLK